MAYLQTQLESDGMPANAAQKRYSKTILKNDIQKARSTLRRPEAEKFLAFAPQKSAKHRNAVIALLENQPARD
jgi:hypothetical protein